MTSIRAAACQVPHVYKDMPRALSLIESYAADARSAGGTADLLSRVFSPGLSRKRGPRLGGRARSQVLEFSGILRRIQHCEPIIVVGFIERDGEKFYNSTVAINRGQVIACYRKNYLLRGEESVFARGTGVGLFDVSGIKVGINICYDLNFSEPVRHVARQGAALVVCPCNNMMRRSSAERSKSRHNEIRAKRAQEQRVWLLSSDVTGESDGRVSLRSNSCDRSKRFGHRPGTFDDDWNGRCRHRTNQ